MLPDDDSVSLPTPPPPRPASREAAIGSALRRFDGIEDRPAVPGPSRWTWNRHPQLGFALAASLVVAIGLPAAFIAIRDQGASPVGESATSPHTAQPRRAVVPSPPVPEAAPEPGSAERRAVAPPGAPPVRLQREEAKASPVAEAQAAPSADMAYAAAPPPPPLAPPPPPPAPPAPPSAQVAEKAVANGLVVTGSRIPRPNVTAERESDVTNSLPARDAVGMKAESVFSPAFRACFLDKDAPLNAESYDCLDREYHRLDRLLASEYGAALARQPNEAGKRRLQQDQRSWLRARFRHCKDEVGDLRGSTGAVVNEYCEISALAERISKLRHSGR